MGLLKILSGGEMEVVIVTLISLIMLAALVFDVFVGVYLVFKNTLRRDKILLIVLYLGLAFAAYGTYMAGIDADERGTPASPAWLISIVALAVVATVHVARMLANYQRSKNRPKKSVR